MSMLSSNNKGGRAMSPVQMQERETIANAVLGMDDETFAKAASYIAYLIEQERREDADDAAYAESVKDEPTVPLHMMLKECGLE